MGNSKFDQFNQFNLRAGQARVNNFRALTDSFAKAAASCGVQIIPYKGDGPKNFAALPAEKQAEILEDFGTYHLIAQQMIAANESITAEYRFLWRMIQHLGLRPTTDLFSILEDDDVIEIYTIPDNIQIFRNMRFFANCSYTLDDVLCRPYWELFRRDQYITNEIFRTAKCLVDSPQPKTICYNLPPHELEEIDSEAKFQSSVVNKYLSPLFDAQKNVVAAVNVMSGRVHSSNAVREISRSPSVEGHKYFE